MVVHAFVYNTFNQILILADQTSDTRGLVSYKYKVPGTKIDTKETCDVCCIEEAIFISSRKVLEQNQSSADSTQESLNDDFCSPVAIKFSHDVLNGKDEVDD
jgi:hypothetical protein